MTLPQNVKDALSRVQIMCDDEAERSDIGVTDWPIVRAHLLSQESELDDYKNASLHSADDLVAKDAEKWMPIETAPRDGTPILIADIDGGVVYDVLHGHFEVLADDEDDGPWDIRDGEPWCSYVGRESGIYFCHWLPGKEWGSRWQFGPNSGYTHWMPLPSPPTDRRTPEQPE